MRIVRPCDQRDEICLRGGCFGEATGEFGVGRECSPGWLRIYAIRDGDDRFIGLLQHLCRSERFLVCKFADPVIDGDGKKSCRDGLPEVRRS